MLNSLSTPTVFIPCNDSYPRGFSETTLEQVKNMKQSDTGGLAYALELKVGARIMLCNIDINDRLINGQLGKVIRIKSGNNRVEVIYIGPLCKNF